MLSSSSALYPTTSTLSTADFTKALEFTHQQNESVPQQERIAAEQYLMALRGSPDGLNLAFHIISNEAFQDIRCFWAFNTIIHHLPDVAQSVDGPQALMLYQTLMSWLHRSCQSHILPDFMFNKHAQTVVVGIQELYPSRWTTVFDDLFALLEKRETMPHVRDYLTMYFLRIFEYIDERVVSVRGKDRAREQRQRDMEVKDAMREAVIVQAVQAWYNILCEYRARQPEVARVCLDVLQLYVEWIDIHLVVTSEWMHLLYFVTTLPNLRQSGCDCLFNIVAKKQLPQVKYDTVTAMGIVDALPRIVGMVPVVSSDEEEAFMVSVVSLTNGLAEQLLVCTDAGIAGAAEALHLVVAEVLKLFSIAHFQVRELTLPFVQLYIKSSALGDSEAGELLHLLYRHTIISPSDWLPQQPDDVIDQRKTLHNLMRLMHRRFPQLVIDHCSRVVFQVVSVSSPAELPNIEAEGAMRYLFELGELVRMDVVLKDSTSPFASMIYHLLNCTSIAGHPDPLVHLAYFELMDRYAQFFVHHRDQVAILLQQLLLMPCGITNAQQRVRSRVCYLCSHMLQTLKMQCVPHAAHIVSAMKEVFDHAALVTSDKLDLYEGIGTVMDVIDQRKTLHNLMRLMHRRFPQLVIDHCSRVVFQVVSVSSPAELPNIEAEGAMRYLFELGELVRMDVVLKDSTSPFASMIYHLLNCTSIAGHPDPLVHLAYFELMDRYAQFFVHHRDQVAILLQQLLLMPCGITNAQQRVRSRVCYLCSHMLQTLKMQCVPHAAHIVSAMKEVFDHAALVTSDKLDLYEGIGTVMSVSDISMCVEVAERVLLHM
ncbi:tRNA exportin, putative, partial [Bodo saltans]